MLERSLVRLAHKWASPPSPNMDALKLAIHEQLSPIYFTIRNDISAGPWNTDQNFYGLICSPKFEGKDYQEMYRIVEEVLISLGMNGRCRFSLEPPSRWNVRFIYASSLFLGRNSTERRDGSGVSIREHMIFRIPSVT